MSPPRRGAALREGGAILLLAAASAAAWGTLGPRPEPPPSGPAADRLPALTFQDVMERLHSGGTVFLDARPSEAYAAGRIPGALSLPSDRFEDAFPKVAPRLDRELPIVVYCSGPRCEKSHEVAVLLLSAGYSRVSLFPSGWEGWMAGGGPVEMGHQHQH